MDRERWQRIDRLLDVALDLPTAERRDYVHQACGGDAALRHEVEELLAALDAPEGFLAQPAADRAARLIADAECEPAGDQLIGRIVGRYRLVRELGEGG